jgi:hypothetical protein
MTDETYNRPRSKWPYVFAVIIGALGLFDIASGEQAGGFAYILLAVATVGFAWSEQREKPQLKWAAWVITAAAVGLLMYIEFFHGVAAA